MSTTTTRTRAVTVDDGGAGDARRLSRRSSLLALGGIGSVLVACGPGDAPAGGPAAAPSGPAGTAAPRRLRIGTSFVVSNLVPAANPQWHMTYGMAQTLYRILPGDKLAPWIATSIDLDGQEGVTIKLNPKAKFHNGRQIAAEAVQASLEYHVARGVPVPSLKGARYETPDPLTLRVRTSQPDPWLVNYLATAAFFPIFDVSEMTAQSDPAALVGKGYFSGPFRATGLTTQKLTLDAVPDAWDGAPKLAGVDVVFVQDPQARFTALKTGELDLLLYTPADAVPIIQQTPGLAFKATSTAELVWVPLNHRRPPFDTVGVRQAFAMSIDRKTLADKVLNGAYDAFDSIYPSAMSWNVPGVLKTDLAAARKLLDDAGWRAGGDGIRVKDGKRLAVDLLHYPQQPDSKPMAEAVQAAVKAVGFEVRLKQSDDINASFRSGDFDAGVVYNSMQKAGNPMGVLNQSFLTDSVNNYGGWGSAEMDGVIKRLNVEFDATKRNDLLKQLQEAFRKDVPITFTVSKQWSAAVNADFGSYVAPHDNHAYVVTKDTAPGAKK
jgi:peptide/nickel transport system substrate-binding protein